MAYFWKEPDFLLLTLKKKKSLSKSSHGMFIIVRTIETGVFALGDHCLHLDPRS